MLVVAVCATARTSLIPLRPPINNVHTKLVAKFLWPLGHLSWLAFQDWLQ